MFNKSLQDRQKSPFFSRFLGDPALYKFFKKAVRDTSTEFAVLSFPVDAVDPLACLEILAEKDAYRFYWEKPYEEFAIAAGNISHSITNNRQSRFADVKNSFADLKEVTAQYSAINHSYAGLHLFGGGSFYNEPPTDDWKGFETTSFILPVWTIIRDGELGIVTIALQQEAADTADSLMEKLIHKLNSISAIFEIDSDDVLDTNQSPASYSVEESSGQRQRWNHSIENAKELIRQNEFDKIVLARSLKINFEDTPSPTFLLNRLRRKYPNCYSFLIKFPGSDTFICCSPERLVSFHKSYLRTDALAGSINRGASATEDVVLEKKLRNSKKDISEHRFVTKSIEQKLADFTDKIERGPVPTVKKLSNVQHLYTPIRARMNSGADRFSILQSLHPTPAVGGYPWKNAASYLPKLEHIDRGWYAGPVGWVNSDGAGEFSVAIRSGLIGQNYARFFAGCGIVEDSDADAEWEETNLKFLPMLSVLDHE